MPCVVMQARAYVAIKAVAYNDSQDVHAVTDTGRIC